MYLKEIQIVSKECVQCIDITSEVEEMVRDSGVQNGTVFIMTKHTTNGLFVNEPLPCVEQDILDHLEYLAPEYGDYVHNRYLSFDGCVGFNANAHIKGVLLGYFLYFPIQNKRIVKGSRQAMYLVELDGPKTRSVVVQIMGE